MADTGYDVWLGVDVGKSTHHATAVNAAGVKIHDKELPQDEARLAAVFDKLNGLGRVLVIVDQPASIGALTIAVARGRGIDVAYLPGLAMRRIADLHPGRAKTDARDAYIIAEAARTMPHALRRVDTGDEALTNLEMLVGFDDDLRGEATRVSNRIRGLLLSIHPALERAIGPHLDNHGVLELLVQKGGPTRLASTRETTMTRIMTPGAPRKAARVATAIKQALAEQSVTVAGTTAAELILPRLAASLQNILTQRAEVAGEVEQMLTDHPLSHVLASMPGVGARTAARILVEIGDINDFATPGHLASYAGLAPVTRRSGTSIRGEHPNRCGNRHLKNALFLSAFAALRADPLSRAYYDRKRAEGKRHNAALMCLARRRTNVLFAMLKNHTPYEHRTPTAA